MVVLVHLAFGIVFQLLAMSRERSVGWFGPVYSLGRYLRDRKTVDFFMVEVWDSICCYHPTRNAAI